MKFLVIDNAPAERERVLEILTSHYPSSSFVVAGTFTEFDEALNAFDFDVVLTAYALGWGTGVEVLETLRGLEPDVPVILLVDSQNEKAVLEAVTEIPGTNDYALKDHLVRLPFTLAIALERANMCREHSELLARLEHKSGRSVPADEQVMRLSQAYEELQVAEEELRVQNEEISRSQQAITLERQRYHELFELAPDGYLVTDPQGFIQEANQTALTLLNTTQEEIYGRPIDLFVVEEERTDFHLQMAHLRHALQESSWEVRMAPQEGAPFYASIAVMPIRNLQNRLEAFHWMIRDVTERVEAEQERERLLAQVEKDRKYIKDMASVLDRERQKLQVVMENTPAQLAYLDADFNFVTINSAYAQSTGRQERELIGQNYFDLFPNPDIKTAFEQVRSNGEPLSFHARPMRPEEQNHPPTYWDWTLVPVKGWDENVQGLVLSLLDVTQRERSKQEREAHTVLLSRLISVSEEILAETAVESVLEHVVHAACDLTAACAGRVLYGFQEGGFKFDATAQNASFDCSPPIFSGEERSREYLELLGGQSAIRLSGEELLSQLPWWAEKPCPREVQSLLGARLVSRGGHVNGLILLAGKHSYATFTSEDEVLLNQLAALASLGVQHIVARTNAERRADEMDTIFRAMTNAVVVYDANGVPLRANPAAIAAYGLDPVAGDRATLARRLEIRHADGRPVSLAELPSTRALRGETVVGERYIFTNAHGQDLTILVAASPLWSGERVSGVVAVWHDITEREWVRIYNETLNRMNAAITSSLDFDEVIEQVLSDAVSVLGVDAAAVALREGELWTIRYLHGMSESVRGLQTSDEKMALTLEAGRQRKPSIFSQEDEVSANVLQHYGVQSVVMIPMVLKEQIVGVISFIDYTDQIAFNSAQFNFADKLATSVSLALDNARLYAAERWQRRLFQAVIDNAPAGIVILDGETYKVRWTNAAAYEFLSGEIEQDDLRGVDVTQIVPSIDQDEFAEIVREVMASGRPFVNAEQPVHSDDDTTYWNWILLPLPGVEETEMDLMLVATDVTDQVVPRQRVEEERRRLQVILDTLPVGVVLADKEGRMVETNKLFDEIWRGRAPMTKGVEDYDVYQGWWAGSGAPLRGEDWPLARAIRYGEVSYGEVVDIQRFDGTRGTILNSAAPIRDKHGNITGALVVVQDITARKQLEETLEQRNRDLNTLNLVGQKLAATLDLHVLLQQLLGAVTELTDADKSCVWLRDELSEDRLICRAASDKSLLDTLAEIRPRQGEGIAGWVADQGESIIISQVSGDTRFSPETDVWPDYPLNSVLAVPLRFQDRVVGVLEALNKAGGQFSPSDRALVETLAASAATAIENARLVDALRQRTDELQARNDELKAFAHTVAHDLKAPLAPIVGFAEMLSEELETFSEAELRKYLNTIRKSGRKMTNIIEELLLLAEVREKDVSLHVLDTATIVREAQNRIAPLYAVDSADVSLPESWPPALGHAPWVEEVWANYLSNALKYGGSPPRVELGATVEPRGGWVRFWVRDYGPGIAPEDQARLFAPFTQVGRKRHHGHGLGLSIVRRIVEKLGGTVGVKSAPGEGSTFYFTLPAATERADRLS